MQAAASASISSTVLSVGVNGSSSSGCSSALERSSPSYLSSFSTTLSGINPIVSPVRETNFSAANSASYLIKCSLISATLSETLLSQETRFWCLVTSSYS